MHHITHIKNLDSILSKKYLYSRSLLQQQGFVFEDTADCLIIIGRENNRHKINFNDYVPFHLDKIQETWGIGYNFVEIKKYGKENLVYLIFDVPTENVIYSLFHPLSSYSVIFHEREKFIENFKKELSCLPQKSNKYLDFCDEKVQQFLKTEILIKDKIGIDLIREIYVHNDNVKKAVECILNNHNIKISVVVNPNFF